MTRFVVDAQLPPALAIWLTQQGHWADHVGPLGMQAAADTAIWDYALRENAAIVTKDEDFAQRKVLSGGGPVVIWVRLPNARSRAVIAWFCEVFPVVVRAIDRGETLVEVM